jgi:hypothetical protein
MCRKPCKECPWTNNNPYSLKFRQYTEKVRSVSKTENHSCHMINKDVWGLKTKINEKNVCIGSKLYSKK